MLNACDLSCNIRDWFWLTNHCWDKHRFCELREMQPLFEPQWCKFRVFPRIIGTLYCHWDLLAINIWLFIGFSALLQIILCVKI